MKPDGLVEVQWEQAQFRVCNPAGGKERRFSVLLLENDWLLKAAGCPLI